MRVRTSTWLTAEFAKELFTYLDGQLFWKTRRSNRCKSGAVGQAALNGYVNVSLKIDGRSHTCGVHQIVWVLHGGIISDDLQLDHKDRNRANNRIENLRQATGVQNKYNRRPVSHLGWKGIARCSSGIGWRVFTSGQEISAGTCIYDAATIYNFLIAEAHGDFAVYNQTVQPWLVNEFKF